MVILCLCLMLCQHWPQVRAGSPPQRTPSNSTIQQCGFPGTWQAHQWTCRSCAHDYDLGGIEAQLVAAARAQARAYQLQDLRCRKCRQVCALLKGMGTPCLRTLS